MKNPGENQIMQPEQKTDGSAAPTPPAAAEAAEARLRQRRALLKALTVATPVALALSAPKPAWAEA